MRRMLVVVAGVVLALAVAAPAPAATSAFGASFQEFFGRANAHPCVPATPTVFTCGVGTITGYGAATSTFEVLSFDDFDPETACGTSTARRVITLSDGTGSLVLAEAGSVCFPGKSFFTPGAASGHSYGNPVVLELTWTVSGGTGVFAGASGSGTDSFRNAGDSGHADLTGTLTLP